MPYPSSMTSPLSPLPITSIPLPAPVHPDDVAATTAGLHGGYRSSDLYTRYRGIAEAAGRVPGASNMFGRALKAAGHLRAKDTSGSVRCWIIN